MFMRCFHCGQNLPNPEAACPRCGACNDTSTRKHELLVSVALVLIALVVVGIIAFVVLTWHDAQLMDTPFEARELLL